jgi:hypothetical protein
VNELQDKPKGKTKPLTREVEVSFPTDREILNALYNHYGRPEHIVKEKVKLYKNYTNPAGHSSPDWVLDGWQQGRVTVFTGHKVNADDLFYTTKIQKEGVGTWFIAIKGGRLKVSISGKVDTILEMEI